MPPIVWPKSLNKYRDQTVSVLHQSTIQSLPLLARGKVRDMYAVGDDMLLIVASDRLSAFDVILDDPIPGKGSVLTELTEFWLKKLSHIVPNHATGIDPETVVAPNERDQVHGRAMVVKRLKPIMVEAVARGYLIGSGWKDYQATGQVCGVQLAAGLKQASKLPEPIFTPAAKAEMGAHDENVDFEYVVKAIGSKLAEDIRHTTLALYQEAAAYATQRGIIIADTKFEFGLDAHGTLHLMDEVLTPDSSRFWPADQWQEGMSPPSFDKQFVRDWLETQPWPKTPPAPRLPQNIIDRTAAKYREACTVLTVAF
jgi:phosphoribosylaminoimidazole-succinocarboxamide synthase